MLSDKRLSWWRRPAALRGYLALLVLSILAPALVFAAVIFSRYYDSELARVDEELNNNARELALTIDRDLQGQLYTLQALSTAQLLAGRNFEAFHRQATRVRGFTGLDILLRDRSKQQLLNTRVPWGTPLPVEEVPGDDEVIATKQPYITGVFVGAIARRPLYTITVPVVENGEVMFFLQLSLELRRLTDILTANIRIGRTAGIFDRNNLLMARTRGPDEFVGKPAPASFMAQAAGSQGSWRGIDVEGEMVRAGFARSKLAGWSIWVSMPESAVQSSLQRAFWTLAALGMVLVLFAATAVVMAGRRLGAATASLMALADALGRGEPVANKTLRVREFDQISSQLASASARRHELEKQLVRKATYESEERFKLLFQGITDYAIYMLDPKGHITNWNTGATRIKGYSEAEVLGQHFSMFYPEEDRQQGLPNRVLQAAEREGRFEGEGWRVRKGGQRFWANVTVDPIRDPDGRLIGFAKITRDVTEKREAQKQLDAAREQLYQSQKMDAVGQLTGGIAHDFNNLLTIIIGNLDTAKRTLESWKEGAQVRVARAVDHALIGARRATTLTSHLLAFARRQPLEVKALDVNKLLIQMSEFLRPSLGEKVQLEVVGGGGLWQIEVDHAQLETAIVNLALNARDAMPEGGKLTIEAGNVYLDEDYCAKFSEVRPGQYVVLSVSDSGIGMSEKVRGRAVEPFFTTKQAGEGTGLGLSQVYGFLKQSGGHLRIYSELGSGTTVKMYLPRSHAEAEDLAAARPTPLPTAYGTESILVVEDDADVRAFVCSTLRELNYTVLEAHDAVSAMKVVGQRPDLHLVLSDVILPGQNGRELSRAIREQNAKIKVLFMTGYSSNAIVHQGRLDPGIELIQKPLTQASLASKIRTLLDHGT